MGDFWNTYPNINLITMKTITFSTVSKNLLTAVLVVVLVNGTGCKKDDPKPPSSPACTTTCQNGGTVTASCECDCPNGFYGTNCQNQQTPTAFRVNQIVLTNWPATYNQNQIAYAWDNDGTGPDIFFRFAIGTTSYLETGRHDNCIQGTNYTYNVQNDPSHFPFALGFGTLYDLKIMDKDGTQDHVMLNSSINMANFDIGLPTTINLSAGGFTFRLEGVWLF